MVWGKLGIWIKDAILLHYAKIQIWSKKVEILICFWSVFVVLAFKVGSWVNYVSLFHFKLGESASNGALMICYFIFTGWWEFKEVEREVAWLCRKRFKWLVFSLLNCVICFMLSTHMRLFCYKKTPIKYFFVNDIKPLSIRKVFDYSKFGSNFESRFP